MKSTDRIDQLKHNYDTLFAGYSAALESTVPRSWLKRHTHDRTDDFLTGRQDEDSEIDGERASAEYALRSIPLIIKAIEHQKSTGCLIPVKKLAVIQTVRDYEDGMVYFYTPRFAFALPVSTNYEMFARVGTLLEQARAPVEIEAEIEQKYKGYIFQIRNRGLPHSEPPVYSIHTIPMSDATLIFEDYRLILSDVISPERLVLGEHDNKDDFVTAYASVSAEEDFAETVSKYM